MNAANAPEPEPRTRCMHPSALFRSQHPHTFYLDESDLAGMERRLRQLHWIEAEEQVLAAGRAGESNMNCALRLQLGNRSLIVKQARPWVEKYPSLAAPWDRALVEAAFYKRAGVEPELASAMPQLLGVDEESRMLCLEDLGEARDYTDLYHGDMLPEADRRRLIDFLRRLHASFPRTGEAGLFANRAMRELNHFHIFVFPLDAANGFDLDAITPGLAAEANRLRTDQPYCDAVKTLGALYREDGDVLLHGDFFPGSWLQTPKGPKVIDPEFCFYGPSEFDFGVMQAHLVMARQRAEPDLPALALRFAGVEIMRRLIGVAQLPMRRTLEEKSALLSLSRRLVLES